MGFLFNRIVKPNIINRLGRMEKRIMAALHELQAHVEALHTVGDSVVALLEGLHQKLQEAGTDEAKLNEIKDSIASETQRLADAVAKNTIAEGE